VNNLFGPRNFDSLVNKDLINMKPRGIGEPRFNPFDLYQNDH